MTLADKLHIDPAVGSPYDQVRSQIVDLITGGELLVGERLPTVRSLAVDLGLAANTVARSYRELESAGFIETRGRSGSFVRSGRSATLDSAQLATVEHVKALRELGIDDEMIVTLVQRAIANG
ncbi:GntR family transcriptional regulator [Gordonia sp. ABSL1-1]|uniref:GntR family transcriptional regulator n=1 Tax=Gordonia sp. ABSL1-1 TaxID=3053923 RepID=UPI002572D584|nr:GntR family transcriptional regulator [Gordonia sp. ABSL1-1]MDL9938247.1 GntR family transcriptional regulator [Gordonia sp. ABSL1-1]